MDDPNRSKDHFWEGAQDRVTQKSYLQRMVDYITGNGNIKYVHMYPEISVEQGSQTLDILCYKEESGRAKLNIKLPTGSKFKNIPKTQTEIVNLQEGVGHSKFHIKWPTGSQFKYVPKPQTETEFPDEIVFLQEDAGHSKLDIELPNGSKFKYSSEKKLGTECQDDVVNLYVLNGNSVYHRSRREKKKLPIYENTSYQTSLIDKYIEKEKYSSMHRGRYHKTDDKEMGKETTDSESKTAMLSTPNLSPGVFEKQGNSEVWKFINERTKIPNTCKRKQSTHRLNQEVNWDELIQGIVEPGRDRTEHEPENGRYGGNKDKIKTDVVNPEQEFPKSINVFHTTKKEKRKLCKVCQNRELDTIFLPCGHLVFCNFCCASLNIKLCPQCFKEIEHVNEAHF